MLLFWVRVQFLPKLDLRDGQKVRVTGTLSEEPQAAGNQQKFQLGQFEIVAKRYPEYHFGDSVAVTGKVQTRPLATDSFPLLSFISPLVSYKTYQLNQPDIKRIAGVTGIKGVRSVRGFAIKLRVRLLKIFNRVFPRPLDGIVAGIVLGDKSMIPPDFWLKLKQTGTLHIMVASGMNIAMFSQGMLKFFLLFFKRRLAICCLLVVIWFYSIMTGLAPPMIRAATMMSLIYLGSIFGRETEGGRILLITGLLMIFGSPFLLFDVSFQLSFMATAGLVWIQPLFKKQRMTNNQISKPKQYLNSNAQNQKCFGSLEFSNLKLFGIWCLRFGYFRPLSLVKRVVESDNFTSSLAAQIATLPILVVNFGQMNLLSPLINLIILWTIPFILQLGMAIGLMGLMWIKLAALASYLAYPLLFFLEQSINFFAKITFFQISLPRIGWGVIVFYYLMLWLWIKKFAI